MARRLALLCPRRQKPPHIGKSVEDWTCAVHFTLCTSCFSFTGSPRRATLDMQAFPWIVHSEKRFVRLKLLLVHNVAFGFVHRLYIAPEQAKTPERMRSDV
jgi:hypothetical protein